MRTRKRAEANRCAWCDDPSGAGALCPSCRAVHDHPLFHCWKDPRHTTPTSGPSCAECAFEAERRARVAAERAPLVAQLRAVREQHVRDWHVPWPGCEFGKALFGRMVDGALASLGASPRALP